ncbi:hypothetical protein QFC19_001615 [Naganishia cerealis]|uniref:Uncharacterized protein n=1 Tax=Naganishia cerealis TaxID=610337 RepID=A0ACC2WH55_9TREE|nr:hypothetical protein QFC19_001615 [Naganishia cerealis]
MSASDNVDFSTMSTSDDLDFSSILSSDDLEFSSMLSSDDLEFSPMLASGSSNISPTSTLDDPNFSQNLNPQFLSMMIQLEQELGDRPKPDSPDLYQPPFTHVNPANVFPPRPLFYFEQVAVEAPPSLPARAPPQALAQAPPQALPQAPPQAPAPSPSLPPSPQPAPGLSQQEERPKVPRSTSKNCAEHKGMKVSKKIIDQCEACKVGRNTSAYIEATNPNREKGYVVWTNVIPKEEKAQGEKRQRKLETYLKVAAEREWFTGLLSTPEGREYIRSILPSATFDKLMYTYEQRVRNNVVLPNRYYMGA